MNNPEEPAPPTIGLGDAEAMIDALLLLRHTIQTAKQTAQWSMVYDEVALDAWRTLSANRPSHFSAALGDLPTPRREELLRVLNNRRRGQDEPVRGNDLDDWPGHGNATIMLETEAPPLCWFVRNRLVSSRAALVTGIGGSSKTRLLYHLALAAVTGRLPWGWEVERTGSAALVLAEDTADGVHRTLNAMANAMRLSATETELLGQRLAVFPLAGRNNRLLIAPPFSGGALEESYRVSALISSLRELPPPLVFVGLDPALALTEGDEANPAHQRRLGELADRIAIELDTCVVLTSHASKFSASTDEPGSHTSRGSGAITDAVRAEFVLRTMTAGEAKTFGVDDIENRKAHVQLVATKGNELAPSAFAPLWLRRGSGGVLEPAQLEIQTKQAIGTREMEALDVLRRASASGTVTMRTWRERCTASGVALGRTPAAQEKAMERIRDALIAAGLAEKGIARGVVLPVSTETEST